jgi:hypothetical protein
MSQLTILPRTGKIHCHRCGASYERPKKTMSLSYYIEQLQKAQSEHTNCRPK